MRDDQERLKDILEAIESIEKYASKGREAFASDELIQVWIVRHLQIIGESARFISGPLQQSHPEIAWPKIIGMRNILVHHYFEIDLPIVWNVVERELPHLKRRIGAILQEIGEG